MKLLIRNALIVTMNEQNDVIEKGSIVIDGNQLAYVGPVEWTPPGPFGQTIDGDRMIAVPGMVNSHCHSPANLVRGMMPSKPLEIWRAYYRASLRGMRDEDFYASALLGGMEMLKSGATTVLDHFAGSASCRFMGAGAACLCIFTSPKPRHSRCKAIRYTAILCCNISTLWVSLGGACHALIRSGSKTTTSSFLPRAERRRSIIRQVICASAAAWRG